MLLILIAAYELDNLTSDSQKLKRRIVVQWVRAMCWFRSQRQGEGGEVCLHQCLVVTENIWGFPLDRKWRRQLTMHASLLKRGVTEAKFRSFCSWLPKLTLHLQPTETAFCLKMEVKTMFIYIFLRGIISSTFPSQPTAIYWVVCRPTSPAD